MSAEGLYANKSGALEQTEVKLGGTPSFKKSYRLIPILTPLSFDWTVPLRSKATGIHDMNPCFPAQRLLGLWRKLVHAVLMTRIHASLR